MKSTGFGFPLPLILIFVLEKRSAVERNGGSGLVSEGNVKCGCDRVSCDCDENWPNWARSGPDNLVQSN